MTGPGSVVRDEGAAGLLFGQAVHWAAERGAEWTPPMSAILGVRLIG